MKDKIKNLIALLLILVIICVIIMFVILKKNNSKLEDYSNDSEGVEESIKIELNNIVKCETNKNIYYTVVSIITKYIDCASINDSLTLLNMLDQEYISKYKMNEDNVIQTTEITPLDNYSQYYIFRPDTIYSVDEGSITTHFVYGYYYNISDMKKKDINLMVQLDTVNQTFNIYDNKYISDNGYNNLKAGDSYNAHKEEIQDKEDNRFQYVSISDEDMAIKYLNDYKNIALYDTTRAYEFLNKDYSKRRFESEQDFIKFVESKKIEIFKAQLEQYKVIYAKDGNKIYICKDQNENYYKFEETEGIMKYKVILDNYTIPDDDFINKYKESTEQVKVALNIEKFMQAINAKDYKYAYNCLADSFKDNYFKTQADFENYARENFYENSTVEYNQFESQGDIYTYSVILKDKVSGEQKTKTFIMRLGEETNFEMSFNR